MKFEAFLITNRRSTLWDCTKSLIQQTCQVPVTIIQNKKWLDALTECLERCRSPYFIRVDDDFMLNKRAFEYMWSSVRKLPDKNTMGLYCCQLWEDWTHKAVRGIKMYRTEALREIGGFVPDEFGKVDKLTNAILAETGFAFHTDKSIVGVHACSSLRDQLRYEQLWSAEAKQNYIKSTHNEMKTYAKKHDLRNQIKLASSKSLLKFNKPGTGFYNLLKEKD